MDAGFQRNGPRAQGWTKAVGLALVILCAGNLYLWLVQSHRETLEARRFVVKDDQGRDRAALGLAQDGSPGLALYDGNGTARVSLLVVADRAPKLILNDENGQPVAILGIGMQDAPILTLCDRAARSRATLMLQTDGSPSLRLASEDGKSAIDLVVETEAGAGISVSHAKAVQPVTIGFDGAGAPRASAR